MAKVFGDPIAQVSGIVADRLRFVRWKRLMVMADEVDRVLGRRGIVEIRAVPPKLALPILEDGSLEDDESLQALWTGLLANAMDPNFQAELRTAYVDIIRSITPRDALILQDFYEVLKREGKLGLAELGGFFVTKEQGSPSQVFGQDVSNRREGDGFPVKWACTAC